MLLPFPGFPDWKWFPCLKACLPNLAQLLLIILIIRLSKSSAISARSSSSSSARLAIFFRSFGTVWFVDQLQAHSLLNGLGEHCWLLLQKHDPDGLTYSHEKASFGKSNDHYLRFNISGSASRILGWEFRLFLLFKERPKSGVVASGLLSFFLFELAVSDVVVELLVEEGVLIFVEVRHLHTVHKKVGQAIILRALTEIFKEL